MLIIRCSSPTRVAKWFMILNPKQVASFCQAVHCAVDGASGDGDPSIFAFISISLGANL